MERQGIAIDIDDTSLHFITPFLNWYNVEYGTSWRKTNIHSYDLWVPLGGTREEMIEKMHLFYETDAFRNLRAVQGAKESIQRLGQTYDITFVPARPIDLTEITTGLIHRHFGDHRIEFANHYARNGHPERAKASICKEVGAQAILDDSGKYARECAQEGIDAIIMDQPWNRDIAGPRITRAYGWVDAERAFEKILRRAA